MIIEGFGYLFYCVYNIKETETYLSCYYTVSANVYVDEDYVKDLSAIAWADISYFYV